MMLKQIHWKALLASLAISLGAGALGYILTSDSMQQYGQLYRPPLAPPGWVFPVVWTILYILMGVSAYLVYINPADSQQKKSALLVYGIQLVVNVLWSVIFFNLKAYPLALVWILLLWYLIFRMIRQFKGINETAGKLNIPYLAWVTFATYLTLAITIYYW